jgi:hypothetical protein
MPSQIYNGLSYMVIESVYHITFFYDVISLDISSTISIINLSWREATCPVCHPLSSSHLIWDATKEVEIQH